MIPKWLSRLVSFVGSPAPAPDDSTASVITPAEFTGECARILQDSHPAIEVAIKDELELITREEGEARNSIYLHNSYQEYIVSPEGMPAVMEKLTGILSDLQGPQKPVDPAAIMPVIKDRSWLVEIAELMQKRGKKFSGLVYEDLNDELVIVYVEDSSNSVSYLNPETIKHLGIKREDLRSLAVSNLKMLGLDVQLHGSDGLFMLVAGGTYEASLILFEEIWRLKQVEVKGDYIISVPARDILLISGSEDAEGIRKMREKSERSVSDAAYHLTSDLFILNDGKWQKY